MRLRYAGAGLLAGAAGLAVALAGTALLQQRLAPPDAVAEAIIEATPGSLAVRLVHLVGRWDKPLLLTGVLVGLVLFSVLAGLLARRALWAGLSVVLALGLVAAVSVMTRPEGSVVGLLPVLVGTAAWVLALRLLTDPLRAGAEATARSPGPPELSEASRRDFLRRSGLVGAAALVLAVGGRYVGRKRRVVEEARARLRLPVTRGTVPADAEIGVGGLEPWRVPATQFYRIDTAVVVPAVDVSTWRLRIHGMVDREVTLTYQQLLDRRLTEAWVTLCCVSNPVGGDLISNAWWSGVRVADLLEEAGPRPGADAVLQTSQDGWTCGTPLAALTDGRDALLAIAMNGQPLPLEHGFPVRMVVPGLYGFVSATKWVVDLEVTRFEDFTAFWTERGWAPRGPVKTESRIDVPRANHRVTAGSVRVGGVAWAQHTGIERVEVRLDGGPWTGVELGGVPSVDTWVQWAGSVRVAPGNHSLAVRATDRSGYTQTGAQVGVLPDGATGWHTIEFTAE